MKIKNNYEVKNVAGVNIVVPTSGDMSLAGVITLNDSALFIWNELKNDVTEEEIINKMCEEYDAPREVISADVKELLDKLKENNLLDVNE